MSSSLCILPPGPWHSSVRVRPGVGHNVLPVIFSQADGCIMAIQHTKYPVAAVQFHPESILTAPGMGVRMLANALANLKSSMYD